MSDFVTNKLDNENEFPDTISTSALIPIYFSKKDAKLYNWARNKKSTSEYIRGLIRADYDACHMS